MVLHGQLCGRVGFAGANFKACSFILQAFFLIGKDFYCENIIIFALHEIKKIIKF